MKKLSHLDHYFAEPDVHDAHRVGAAGPASLIVSILYSLGHGLNAYWFFGGHSSLTVALIIHIVLSIGAAFLARIFAKSPRESRFFMLLFITSTTLGVFGAVGTLVSVLLHHWYMHFASPFIDWFSSIFPSQNAGESQKIYDDILVGRDESSKPYSVIPFVDVIWYGNETQKRMALSKMTSQFDPAFAPAFRRAMNDNSNTIRVQAATAISKIENQFVDYLMRLTAVYEQDPLNPELMLALASHYDDYAFTGILDADRERNNREQALKYYMLYLDKKPADTDVHARVGRLLIRNQEFDRAADWLKQSIQRGHRNLALLIWYAEALYASRRYAELRHFAREVRLQAGDEQLQAVLANSMQLWEAEGVRA